MEFSDRDVLCPSPNFTIKTQESTTSTFSLHSFKNRLSSIFHTQSEPASPTGDRKSRMSILTSRSANGTNHRRLRKQALRSSKAGPSSPNSMKSAKSLLDKISLRKHMLRSKRMRRFSTFHHKPSTLDFRCAGDETSSIMMLERVNSYGVNRMILGTVQKRRRGDLTYLLSDCAPRISWVQPDIAGWDFSEIGIVIN
ncbi:hypothetical protein ABW19_dt0200517 [Dactylella cylindrospora]|nr:hypothetical protein ABW19_dt0200517 [Dactylella cylindrospora]